MFEHDNEALEPAAPEADNVVASDTPVAEVSPDVPGSPVVVVGDAAAPIDDNAVPELTPIMPESPAGDPLPPDPQLLRVDTIGPTVATMIPVEPEVMGDNEPAGSVDVGSVVPPVSSPASSAIDIYTNLTTSGLVPLERNRLRAALEEQHQRTKSAHDRIIKAMADRAAFMESVAAQVEAQNAEMADYHKNFGS